MPRRAVPELVVALSPANVKDPGGEMSAEYVEIEWDVHLNVEEPHLEEPYPGVGPRPELGVDGISDEDLSQAAGSVVDGYDPAAETALETGPDAGGE
jgi:hypothetical protein